MGRRKRKALPVGTFEREVVRLTHEGRGICHVEGKPVFIDGCLPGEIVSFAFKRATSRYAEGQITTVIQPSPARVTPPCNHASICGGCSLQHLSPRSQLQLKTQALAEQLAHFGNIDPKYWLLPLRAQTTAYRRKARIGVKYVDKKQRLIIGFREKRSNYLTDIDDCQILMPTIVRLLPQLKQLINTLSVTRSMPQIEVAVGDDATALIFRHLQPLTRIDRQLLRQFADEHAIHCYLQPGCADSVYRLWPLLAQPERLHYRLNFADITFAFHPTDFLQVNASLNEKMVKSVVDALNCQPTDYVLDMFCGLGNFSLPIAQRVARVLGIEGHLGMVERAQENARINQQDNAQFTDADLQSESLQWPAHHAGYNKMLLDPPRSGALALIRALQHHKFERIVYVSCNPATLARDLAVLVHEQDYVLEAIGLMDMFVHTMHSEVMAILTPRDP